MQQPQQRFGCRNKPGFSKVDINRIKPNPEKTEETEKVEEE
jgi:hypothetical protein